MKSKVNSYTDDFKLKVEKEYLLSNATVSDMQKKIGIKSRSSISDWVRKFGLHSPTQQEIERENAMKEQRETTPREKELELRIKHHAHDLLSGFNKSFI